MSVPKTATIPRCSPWLLPALALLWVACDGTPSSVAGNSTPEIVPTANPEKAPWRRATSRAPLADNGCFKASYPSGSWEEVPCKATKNEPVAEQPSAQILAGEENREPAPAESPKQTGGEIRAHAKYVFGSTDYMAQVSSGHISWTEGSFPFVMASSVSDSVYEYYNPGSGGNHFSLQINSNTFSNPTDGTNQWCANAKDPSTCKGWQQFWYSSFPPDTAILAMQYWLVNYINPLCLTTPPQATDHCSCPSGWVASGQNCYTTHSAAIDVPRQPIYNLANVVLTASAKGAATGFRDAVMLSIGNDTIYAFSVPSFLDLGDRWTASEFNVLGAGDSSTANFLPNPGTELIVQTLVDNPTAQCAVNGGEGSGENNDLNLVSGSCCTLSGGMSGIQFAESNIPGLSPPLCPRSVPQTQMPIAFQANTNYLWLDWNGLGSNTGYGMMPGTVPSLVTFGTTTSAGVSVAFQANTGVLWTFWNGAAWPAPNNIGMAPGSSPSVTVVPTGTFRPGWESGWPVVAFQGPPNTLQQSGNLWIYNTYTGALTDTGYGMMAQTSPSIATLTNVSLGVPADFGVAFQANSGVLWYYSGNAARAWPLNQAMASGTSPSIAALPNGRSVIAFQSPNTGLYVYTYPDYTVSYTGGAMLPGSSPSLAVLPIPGGDSNPVYAVAFRSSSGNLSYYKQGAPIVPTPYPMLGSPTMVPLPTAVEGFQIAFKDSNTSLELYANGVATNQWLGMN